MSNHEKHSERPLSPHLSIYKPQISSLLSITHRASGFALYVGSILLALWVTFSIYVCSSCITPIITSTIGKIFLFLWSFALFFHLFNGVRHLMWDIGKGFSLPAMRRSGWLVILLSLGATIGVWMCVYGYSLLQNL